MKQTTQIVAEIVQTVMWDYVLITKQKTTPELLGVVFV
jgi:hypothetical protein